MELAFVKIVAKDGKGKTIDCYWDNDDKLLYDLNEDAIDLGVSIFSNPELDDFYCAKLEDVNVFLKDNLNIYAEVHYEPETDLAYTRKNLKKLKKEEIKLKIFSLMKNYII